MWQAFFASIHPVKVTKEKLVKYALRINYAQVLLVGAPEDLLLSAPCPTAPLRNDIFSGEFAKRVRGLFPSLRADGAAVQQSNIATKLDQIAAAQDTQFEAEKLEKEASSNIAVKTGMENTAWWPS